MPTVTVPAEFFRGELRVYDDWREAFVRELIQNSQDANASRMQATFTDHPDGRATVVFDDDGDGMSRQVLEQVFFALGRTTKTGGDTVGGFGRARIITCFAQKRYQIRTGNLHVQGAGSDFTITTLDTFHKGCRFEIDLIDDSTQEVKSAMRSLARSCTLKAPLTIDGEDAPHRRMPGRASRVLRDDDGRTWGKVYVQRGRIGVLIVRVHGLTMFKRYLPGGDDVIVELTPARAREVLVASRDSLSGRYHTQLQQFISQLTSNRRQALRPQAEPLDVHITGGGFQTTGPQEEPDPVDVDQLDASDSTGETDSGPVELVPSAAGQLSLVGTAPQRQAAFAPTATAVHRPTSPPVPSIGFDIYMLADSNDARVRKLARLWNPAGWDRTNGQRRRALLLAWRAATEHALRTLVEIRPSVGPVRWTVGWTFDEDVEGLHRSTGSGHIITLNPVGRDGTTKFKLSSSASRRHLAAIAVHEVAHVVVSDHDERYASLLTDLHAAVDPAAMDRTIRTAAKAA